MSLFTDNCAYIIAKEMGFDPRDNTVYEPHWSDNGKCDYVFANRHDHSNIIIEFWPDQIGVDWDGT